MSPKLCLLIAIAIFVGQAALTVSVSFDEDTKITAEQAGLLNKFRERVRSKLPHKYMEESIFLVRWLRAKNFDLRRAEEMLLQHIQWRRENQIDTIDEEEWGPFQNEFPWYLNGTDKEGRPLVQIILGDWDIRRAVVTGRRGRLTRWVYKYFEDATKLVRKFQGEGKNVTQFTLLLDAQGFNVINHGCPQCMPIYLTISSTYEQHYPGSVDAIHIVNTPEFFNVVLRLVWPILSEDTKKALKVHGTDRKTWRRVLTQSIHDSQMLPTFGGTLNAAQ